MALPFPLVRVYVYCLMTVSVVKHWLDGAIVSTFRSLRALFNHHHHVTLVAQISLTLSRHSSLPFIALGRSSGQHPVSSHSCWMYVRAGRPAFARPCVGVHKSTSLMSSSLWVDGATVFTCRSLHALFDDSFSGKTLVRWSYRFHFPEFTCTV